MAMSHQESMCAWPLKLSPELSTLFLRASGVLSNIYDHCLHSITRTYFLNILKTLKILLRFKNFSISVKIINSSQSVKLLLGRHTYYKMNCLNCPARDLSYFQKECLHFHDDIVIPWYLQTIGPRSPVIPKSKRGGYSNPLFKMVEHLHVVTYTQLPLYFK